MDQQAINDAEWANPDNWSCGLYFSKRDLRILVPKGIRYMGWTINIGRPAGAIILLILMLIAPLAVALGCFLSK